MQQTFWTDEERAAARVLLFGLVICGGVMALSFPGDFGQNFLLGVLLPMPFFALAALLYVVGKYLLKKPHLRVSPTARKRKPLEITADEPIDDRVVYTEDEKRKNDEGA